jgi:glycerate 2-kinase
MRPSSIGHVVIAPDKFTDSLPAAAVAAHLSAGISHVTPTVGIRVAPVADGGEGTLQAALLNGFRARPVRVTGPAGKPVEATIGVRGSTAIVEPAFASGLQPCSRPIDRLDSSSFGTGELIRAALDFGCSTVILGLGGNACTDGGAGMLRALGAQVLDAGGCPVRDGGGALGAVHTLDLTNLDPRIDLTTFLIAGDVESVLLGSTGAATIFASQRGATSEQAAQLDAALRCWARAVAEAVGRDRSGELGAGAAGGVGFGAMAVLNAQARRGSTLLLEMIGFSELLSGARLVLTGEGSLDEQTLAGKAPMGVAIAAQEQGIPVIAVAGVTSLTPGALHAAGFRATYTLDEMEPDLAGSLRDAGPLLERTGKQIALDWLEQRISITSLPRNSA